MKHVVSAWAILCLLLAGISCSQKNAQSKQSGTTLNLALRAGIYADVIKDCLPAFEKEHSVNCNVLELGEDELHHLVASDSVNQSGAYDLCMVDGSWMAEYTAKGVLTDLKKYGYDLDEDIIPATKTICYEKDSLYLAPYYGNVTVLLYNKIMIKEAGFKPEDIRSLEDIARICSFHKKRHNLGFMYRGDTMNNIVVDFLPVLLSYGGWVVDKNNLPTINTPEFRKAMYGYLELIETGRAAKKDDLIAAIANKSAVMGIGWPGWYTPTRNSSMDYLALTGRYRHESAPNNANIYGIWTVGVPENSQHKELAVALLSYLMDKDVQKSTVEKGGVPCRYSSLQDKAILEKFPQYEVVCKALEGGVY
ncbi:MAG: extracellular solute-binding protein, partial [Treponema sp.]|nr:extracellular solute-binding protein [Treponema sp.]